MLGQEFNATSPQSEEMQSTLPRPNCPPPSGMPPLNPDEETEVIFKTVQSLRNRARKLSPHGRDRLRAAIVAHLG